MVRCGRTTRTRQPPNTPCSLGGGAVRQGLVLSNLSGLMWEGTSFIVSSLFEEVHGTWFDAVKPPRTSAQPPDTPCSPSGGAVGEGSLHEFREV